MKNGVNDINLDDKSLNGFKHLSKKEIQRIVAEKFEYFSSLIKYSKNSGLTMKPYKIQGGEEGTFACGLGEEGNALFNKYMEGKIKFSDIPEEYFEPKYLYYWLPWLISKDKDVLGPIVDHELEHAESSDYGDMLINSREAVLHNLPVTTVGMFFNAFEDIYMGKKQIAKGRAKKLGVQNLYKDMFTTTGTLDARGKLLKLDQFAKKALHYWLNKEFPLTFDAKYIVDDDVQEEFDKFIEHLDEIVDVNIDSKERLKRKNETLWPIIEKLGEKDMDRLQKERIKQQIQQERKVQQEQQVQKTQENTQEELKDALNQYGEGGAGEQQENVKQVQEGTQEGLKEALNDNEGDNNSNNQGEGKESSGNEGKENEGQGDSGGDNNSNNQGEGNESSGDEGKNSGSNMQGSGNEGLEGGEENPETNNQGSNGGNLQEEGKNSSESQMQNNGNMGDNLSSQGATSQGESDSTEGMQGGNSQSSPQTNPSMNTEGINEPSSQSNSSNSNSGSESSSQQSQSAHGGGNQQEIKSDADGLGINDSQLEKEIEDRLQRMSDEEKKQMLEEIKDTIDKQNLKEHGEDLKMQKKILENNEEGENPNDGGESQDNGNSQLSKDEEKELEGQKEIEKEMEKQWEDIEKAVEKRENDLENEKKFNEYLDKLEEMTHEKNLQKMDTVQEEYENLLKQTEKIESEDIKQHLKEKIEAMKDYLNKKEKDYEKELRKSGFSRNEEYLYRRYMKLEKELSKDVERFIKKLEAEIPKLKEYHLEGGYNSGRVTDMNEAGRKVRLKQWGEKLYSRFEEKESLEVNLGICLSVDVSGSMSDNIADTMKLVIFLGLLCQKWRIPFHVNTFGESLNIIKDTDDEFEERKGKLMRELVANDGWTNISLSVQKDIDVIKEVKDTHPDTVFLPIFITDGEANQGILGDSLIELMKGFKGLSTMVGIGINEEHLKYWYPNSKVIGLRHSGEIMTVLLRELRQFFRKHKSQIFKVVNE